MRTVTAWLLATMLLLYAGCAGCAARPDWIEATLVTADVTGTWRGRAVAGGRGMSLALVLEQRGPKVTGRVPGGPYAGALEGSVEGDVFRFATTAGSLKGEG